MPRPARKPDAAPPADPVLEAIRKAPIGPPWSEDEKRAIELSLASGEPVDGAEVSAQIAARRCPPGA